MNALARRLPIPVLICLALGVLTLLLFLPSVQHDFLEYDDQYYVTENPSVQAGFTGKSFAWAFGFHAGNWHPLTWLSHILDCSLYGLNPARHHFTNVLLHTASTVLLFLVLFRMTWAPWRSACVAALFGWHPLHVESVAWISERKDVLCAFFWMLTLLAYVRYVEESKVQGPKCKARYGGALILFALALMSKPMAVTLPFVLLLLDWWPLERVGLKAQDPNFKTVFLLVREKIPFFILSAAVCTLTIQAQEFAIVSTAGLTLGQRVTHALVAYAHYAGVMFVPRGLAVFYPYEVEVPVGEIIVAGVVLATITALALYSARRRSWLATGWFWFLGTLVPVIGLVQVGDQAWADRYTYLPLIGLFVCVVWSVAEVVKIRQMLTVAAAVIAVFLLAATTRQLRHWKNTRTLFEHTARVTKDNHMAITMLGSLLAREGKLDEAMAQYRTALRLRPGFPEAHFFLGNALDQQGQLDEAIAEYEQALRFKPYLEQTHILLGIAHGKKKEFDLAAEHLLAALKINPDSAVAHNNLARIRHTQGRLDDAIEHYTVALGLDPKLAQAHNNLGIVLLQKGNLPDGTARLREALRLNPTNAESQFNLALALNQQEQWEEAAELFAKTVGMGFNDANAHYQFALALSRQEKTRESMSHFAQALLAQPDYPDALNGLSWILATAANPAFRNGTEAVRMAGRACELTAHKDPEKLKTLAAALAESGRFPEAIATAQQARDLAQTSNRTELTRHCEAMLGAFISSQPWRETGVNRSR